MRTIVSAPSPASRYLMSMPLTEAVGIWLLLWVGRWAGGCGGLSRRGNGAGGCGGLSPRGDGAGGCGGLSPRGNGAGSAAAGLAAHAHPRVQFAKHGLGEG